MSKYNNIAKKQLQVQFMLDTENSNLATRRAGSGNISSILFKMHIDRECSDSSSLDNDNKKRRNSYVSDRIFQTDYNT